MVARKHNPILRAFSRRLQQAGKSKMAILGAVIEYLVVDWHAQSDSTPRYLRVECARLPRL